MIIQRVYTLKHGQMPINIFVVVLLQRSKCISLPFDACLLRDILCAQWNLSLEQMSAFPFCCCCCCLHSSRYQNHIPSTFFSMCAAIQYLFNPFTHSCSPLISFHILIFHTVLIHFITLSFPFWRRFKFLVIIMDVLCMCASACLNLNAFCWRKKIVLYCNKTSLHAKRER